MKLFHLSCLLLSTTTTTTVVMGSQDSSLWLQGTSNPNTKNPLYYREAYDVLEDLSLFQSLYVQFDSCVYSEAGSAGRDDRNYDDYSAIQVVGEGKNWWYVGNTPFIQANVAFSLYGVLASSATTEGGCTADTFINSFHTLDGINSFLETLETSGIDLSNINFPYVNVGNNNNGRDLEDDEDGAYVYVKDCVASYGGNYSFLYDYADGDGDGNGDNNGDGDVDFGDDAPTAMLQAYFKDLVSFGLKCSGDDFVFASFYGGSCDARRVNSTLDTMDDINYLFEESAECLQIYKYAGNEDGGDGDNGNANVNVGLLSYSQACEHNLKYCPDPHDKLEGYAKKIEDSLKVPSAATTNAVNYTGFIFMGISGLLLVYAGFLYWSCRKLTASPATGDEKATKTKSSKSPSKSAKGNHRGKSTSKPEEFDDEA